MATNDNVIKCFLDDIPTGNRSLKSENKCLYTNNIILAEKGKFLQDTGETELYVNTTEYSDNSTKHLNKLLDEIEYRNNSEDKIHFKVYYLENIYIETVKLSDVWKERNNSKR